MTTKRFIADLAASGGTPVFGTPTTPAETPTTTWQKRILAGTVSMSDSLGVMGVTGHSRVGELWTAPRAGVLTHVSFHYSAQGLRGGFPFGPISELGPWSPTAGPNGTGFYVGAGTDGSLYAAGDSDLRINVYATSNGVIVPSGSPIATHFTAGFQHWGNCGVAPDGSPSTVAADLQGQTYYQAHNGNFYGWCPLAVPLTVTEGQQLLVVVEPMADADIAGRIIGVNFGSTRWRAAQFRAAVDPTLVDPLKRDVIFMATSGPHSTGGVWRRATDTPVGGNAGGGSGFLPCPSMRFRYQDGARDAVVHGYYFPAGASVMGRGVSADSEQRMLFQTRDGIDPATTPLNAIGVRASLISQVPGTAQVEIRRTSDDSLVAGAVATAPFAQPPALLPGAGNAKPAAGSQGQVAGAYGNWDIAGNPWGTQAGVTGNANAVVVDLTFPAPVALQPNVEYEVRFKALSGRYSLVIVGCGNDAVSAMLDSLPTGLEVQQRQTTASATWSRAPDYPSSRFSPNVAVLREQVAAPADVPRSARFRSVRVWSAKP